jgi:hypothetical protein
MSPKDVRVSVPTYWRFVAALALAGCTAVRHERDDAPTYREGVGELLRAKCARCHAGSAPPAGWRADTYESAVACVSSGDSVLAGPLAVALARPDHAGLVTPEERSSSSGGPPPEGRACVPGRMIARSSIRVRPRATATSSARVAMRRCSHRAIPMRADGATTASSRNRSGSRSPHPERRAARAATTNQAAPSRAARVTGTRRRVIRVSTRRPRSTVRIRHT